MQAIVKSSIIHGIPSVKGSHMFTMNVIHRWLSGFHSLTMSNWYATSKNGEQGYFGLIISITPCHHTEGSRCYISRMAAGSHQCVKVLASQGKGSIRDVLALLGCVSLHWWRVWVSAVTGLPEPPNSWK